MFLGKEVRLNRVINQKSGKIVAITLQKGIVEKVFAPCAGQVPFFLKATTFTPYELMHAM